MVAILMVTCCIPNLSVMIMMILILIMINTNNKNKILNI